MPCPVKELDSIAPLHQRQFSVGQACATEAGCTSVRLRSLSAMSSGSQVGTIAVVATVAQAWTGLPTAGRLQPVLLRALSAMSGGSQDRKDCCVTTAHRPFGSQGKPFVPQGKQECLCHCKAKMDGRQCAKHRVRARHAVPLLSETAKAKERVLWCCRCGARCAAIGLERRLKPTLLAIFGELVVEEIG